MKRAVLSRIEIEADGLVGVKLAKQIVDGDQVVASEWHRTVLPKGAEADAQLNHVDANLEQMGYPPIPPEDRAKILAFAELAHA